MLKPSTSNPDLTPILNCKESNSARDVRLLTNVRCSAGDGGHCPLFLAADLRVWELGLPIAIRNDTMSSKAWPIAN